VGEGVLLAREERSVPAAAIVPIVDLPDTTVPPETDPDASVRPERR